MSKKEKKELKKKIEQVLATTFSQLTESIPPQKFERNVRRASRALLAGLKVSAKKKTVEKKSKKKTETPVAIVAA